MKRELKCTGLLLIAALIWGSSFVAQSEGATVGLFTFDALRNIIGAVVLIPLVAIMDRTGHTVNRPQDKKDYRLLLIGGLVTGVALFAAQSLQQLALDLGVGTGKAGFLTSCYILLVPIFGLFLHRKCSWNIWVGVGIVMVGLYFLCIKDGFSIELRDALLLGSALCYAVQILSVGHFAAKTDPIRLSIAEFAVCFLVNSIVMIPTEMTSWSNWTASLSGWNAWLPILYLGVLSTGVAYTLQTVAMPGMNPTVATMVMSLESVFSLLFGFLMLNQRISLREGIGCILVFAAVVLAQLPMEHWAGKRKNHCEQ